MKDSILTVKQRIAECCEKTNRDANEIQLVAVSKTVSAALVEQAIENGISLFGENRVFDAVAKIESVNKEATWHFIGHLQTNKVHKVIPLFDMIQSVDSVRLAEKIQIECKKCNKSMNILVQVNTSGESSKYGFAPEETIQAVERIRALPSVHIRGLMTIGALTEDENKIRACFRLLRDLFEEIKTLDLPNVRMDFLSMGMSDDYPIAIEEGANMLRIGRALFSKQ